MGIGASLSAAGEKAASTFSDRAMQTMEKMNITESTKNMTEVINKMIESISPLEVKVNLDITPNLQDLIEKFSLLVPAAMLILVLILMCAWHMMSCVSKRANGDNYAKF
jgi:hypothetical protein